MLLHLSPSINPNINPASSRKERKTLAWFCRLGASGGGLFIFYFFAAAKPYEQIGQESASKSLMQLSNSWINMFFSQRALSTIYPLIKTSLGKGEMRNARGGTKFTLLWECVFAGGEGKGKDSVCVCVCVCVCVSVVWVLRKRAAAAVVMLSSLELLHSALQPHK